MAQTKKKRSTKHRGNAAGGVESRGRTGRKLTDAEKRRQNAKARGGAPSAAIASTGRRPGRGAAQRSLIAVVIFVAVLVLLFKQDPAPAIGARLGPAARLHPDELLHRPVPLPPPPGQEAAGRGGDKPKKDAA